MNKPASLAAALALAVSPAVAQQSSTPAAKPQASADQSTATKEYDASMQAMHKGMMAAQDADADRAWALKMIEHHRGGVAMSEILIKRGDDAEAKKMAQKTIDAQKKEIAELEDWLTRHGGRPKQ